jgi:fatty-acyl-CoA synthase
MCELLTPARAATQAAMDAVHAPLLRLRERSLLFPDCFEQRVAESADRPWIHFEDRTWTFGDVNTLANRIAAVALEAGLGRDDVVALVMQNRPEYFAVWLGLGKIGVRTAFINTFARGAVLAHAIAAAGARTMICDAPGAQALATLPQGARTGRIWSFDADGGSALDPLLAKASAADPPVRLRAGITPDDDFVYIFTSGTTGLPKAARISHFRFVAAGVTTGGMLDLNDSDVYYNVLPVFHGAGGMVIPSVTVHLGIPMVLRRKFSASQFWPDVRRHRITTLQYIGEICRYLSNQPPDPRDRGHTLMKMSGAGLRADVWQQFRDRFGVSRIIETWGGTEMNCSTMNLDGPIGSCGRVPFRERSNLRLIRYDQDTGKHPRDAAGRCIEVGPNEPGEAIGCIADPAGTAGATFDGYRAADDTGRKILHDVFTPGDRWFRSGDLLRMDADGYCWFVDRVGDTFRWKSENVSTEEVANALAAFPGVRMINVCGVRVPGAEGRAGLAALELDDAAAFDPAAFYRYAAERLPGYAVPLFLRLTPGTDLTASFKLRKTELRREGYDPALVREPLFVLDETAGRYLPLQPDTAAVTLTRLGIPPFGGD